MADLRTQRVSEIPEWMISLLSGREFQEKSLKEEKVRAKKGFV